MTPTQLDALRWVLIEACELHAERDGLSPHDSRKERADLESLIDLLEEHRPGETTEIRAILPK